MNLSSSLFRRCPRSLLLLALAMGGLQPALADNLIYNASGQLTNVTTTPAPPASPVIISDPVSAVVETGQLFALTVNATGLGLNYQWYKGTDLLPGETRASLLFPSITAADLGSYYVSVSNYGGTTPSAPAVLSFPPNGFTAPMGGVGLGWKSGGTTLWHPITDAAQTRVNGNAVIGTGRAFSDDSYLEGTFTVTQPTTLRFWARLPAFNEPEEFSGQMHPCKLDVKVNGRGVHSFDEYTYRDGGWRQYQLHLAQAGTYAVTWQHTENGYVLLDDVTLTNAPDTDNDGLSDDWEMEFFEDLDELATTDTDSDGNTHLVEYRDRTIPTLHSSSVIHVFLPVIGQGHVELSIPEPVDGYPRYGYMILGATAVPDPGHVFVGWEDPYQQPINVTVLNFGLSDSSVTIRARFEPQVPLATGADTTAATWTTGGDAPWISQTWVSADGVDALVSGALPEGNTTRSTWVQAVITGPAKVSYDFRTRSASAKMTVNGMNIGHQFYTYDYNWQTKEVYLPPGSHTLRWTTEHTYISSNNASLCYLDKVIITPHADTDNDGMADEWETLHFGTLARDGTGDQDNDGVSDLAEHGDLTSPVEQYDLRIRLALTTAGPGSGHSVTTTPALPSYRPGDYVLITAVPAPGYALRGWESVGQTYTTNPFTLQIGYSNVAIKANFMPADDLNQALDNATQVFTNSLPGWTRTTTTSHDGVDAAQSPAEQDYGSKSITTNITGPKVIYFWWRLDRQASSSTLTLLDSADQPENYDTERGGWQRVVKKLTPGEHALSWTFSKSDNAGGTSTAWLDQVFIADDTDEDGLADDWELTNFTTLAATSGEDDPDNDGNNNQMEWADGTNPNSATSALFRLAIVAGEKNSVQISPLQETYTPGAQVTLTADAAFTGWSGDATGTTNPLVVTMTRSKTLNAAFQPLALGVDNTKFSFQTLATLPWVLNDTTAYGFVGNDAAESPAGLAEGQETWMETTFTSAGVLNFKAAAYYSTDGGGEFRWLLDGVEVGRYDGYSYSSQDKSIFIMPGTHTVRWVYKQGSDVGGGATARLDNLVFTPMTVVALDEALDSPGTTWTYGSSATPTWLGLTTTTHDGVDAAESRPIDHFGQAVMETTINPTAPTTVSFWWKVSSEQGWDYLTFYNNGAIMPAVQPISGEQDWVKVTFNVPAGPRTLRWMYSKDSTGVSGQDRGWVDQLTIGSSGPAISLAVALDNAALTWTTSPGAPWTGTDATTHDGVDAAVSGTITDGETTWVQTEITGPGVLTFWWKMSGAWWDDYRFTVNGSSATTALTGETNWQKVTVNLPAGNNVLRWSYSRDFYIDPPVGQDSTWLDEVTFTSTAPAGFNTWASGFGYSGADAQPTANPTKDGIPNLLKYAFNMPGNVGAQGANRHVVPGTGMAGLPTTTTTGTAGARRLRLEYIRRRNATDLTYTVQFGSGLNGADWTTPTGTETVTMLDADWERVVIEDTVTSGTSSRRFGRVVLTQTP